MIVSHELWVFFLSCYMRVGLFVVSLRIKKKDTYKFSIQLMKGIWRKKTQSNLLLFIFNLDLMNDYTMTFMTINLRKNSGKILFYKSIQLFKVPVSKNLTHLTLFLKNSLEFLTFKSSTFKIIHHKHSHSFPLACLNWKPKKE